MNRGVAIVTYNRAKQLGDLIECVQKTVPEGTRIVVADDGSTDETPQIVASFPDVMYLRGTNKGVAHNKNRALCALQSCSFVALLEDDLFPVKPGWFEIYETAARFLGVHHFCRVQDKEIPETIESCTYALQSAYGWKPIYGESPRGDLTFVTKRAIQTVGGMHPDFRGVGYAHGEWSNRIAKAGLIPHPLKWIDIQEARDSFEQRGDREGGRWQQDPAVIKQQMKDNRAVQKRLKASGIVHVPLELT